MNTPSASNKGMTLVEVLVAGAIGVIPAALISVLYIMYDTQLRENNDYLAMQRDYETVVQQIALHTRKAHRILTSTAFSEPCLSTRDTVTTIFFFDNPGVLFAGARINADTLQEYLYISNAWTWVNFMAGSTPVLVDPAKSSFILPGCRNRITIDLRLKRPDHDTTFYLKPPPGEFLCRN